MRAVVDEAYATCGVNATDDGNEKGVQLEVVPCLQESLKRNESGRA